MYVWLVVIAYVVSVIACGCMCSDLANEKGHSSTPAFWCGLVFGVMALIYYAGRPVSEEMRAKADRARAEALASALEMRGQNQSGVNGADMPAPDAKPLKNKALAAMDALERESKSAAHRIPIEGTVRGKAQCTCSECKTQQDAGRTKCWHCGRIFED